MPLLLYISAFSAFILALAGRTDLVLMFLIPLYPLQNIYEKLADFPLGGQVSTILVMGMLLGWMLASAKTKNTFFIATSFNFLLLFYILFTYVSFLRGSWFLGDFQSQLIENNRFQAWKGYILLQILFFIVVNNIRNKHQIIYIFIVMCLTILVMNFYNLRQISEMTSWLAREKFHGTFQYLQANEVSAFYANYTFILLGIWLYRPVEIKYRFGLLFLIICNFFIVLFLFSRGAYLSVLVGWMFIAFNRKPMLIIPILCLIIFWDSVLPQEAINRLTFSENSGAMDESAAVRLILWQQSLQYIRENPILGIGFNVFQYMGRGMDTHNLYLRTLAEQGLIGMTFLLSIFGLAFSRGWRLYKCSDDPFFKGLGFGFCVCMLALVLGNIFGDRWTHIPLSAFFWVFLGLIERANFITIENPEKKY